MAGASSPRSIPSTAATADQALAASLASSLGSPRFYEPLPERSAGCGSQLSPEASGAGAALPRDEATLSGFASQAQQSPDGRASGRTGMLSRLLSSPSARRSGLQQTTDPSRQGRPGSTAEDSSTRALLAQAHSHILLRWPDGARPRTVMIVCKPTARVMPALAEAITICIRLGLVRFSQHAMGLACVMPSCQAVSFVSHTLCKRYV